MIVISRLRSPLFKIPPLFSAPTLQSTSPSSSSSFPPLSILGFSDFDNLNMKARFRSRTKRSSSIFGCYLKPGALAQLRNSKITAKSKAKEVQVLTQILLYQHKPTSELASPQPNNNNTMDVVPCFTLRLNNTYPLCLHRKKLIPVAPVFSGS